MVAAPIFSRRVRLMARWRAGESRIREVHQEAPLAARQPASPASTQTGTKKAARRKAGRLNFTGFTSYALALRAKLRRARAPRRRAAAALRFLASLGFS